MSYFDIENEIFNDESVLYPEFIPNELIAREYELKEISFALKPLIKGRKPSNCFVFGVPGTGKTVSCKFLLHELIENSTVNGCYINCWKFNSEYAILNKVLEVFGLALPARGLSTREIILRFEEVLKKNTKGIVIILDEFDKIKSLEKSKLLYTLIRQDYSNVAVIIISNNENELISLDDRVKSSLSAIQIKFNPYNVITLKKILTERARIAFIPGKIEKQAIALAAAISGKKGDARIGIELLLKAGRIAEKNGLNKVSVKEIQEARSTAEKSSLNKAIPSLTVIEKKLLKLIYFKPGITSGDLFNAITLEEKISKRAFRNYVARLLQKKLISFKELFLKPRGRTRTFSCLLSKEIIDSL